ncbi:MAG TPA: hypothetical protein VFF73_26025 [Planctomycetota bacterium]|nr:hypothetical protein [Planctomycetota bacterium]
MSAARASRLLIIFIAGLGMGFAVSWVPERLREETRGSARAASGSSGRDAPSDALEKERAERIAVEDERDALEAELAALESASHAPPAPKVDLGALSSAVHVAVDGRDGKRCRTLLYDLADAGREAWPLVDLIAASSFEVPGRYRETERVLGELEDVFDSKRLRDLAVDALVNTAAHPAALRRAAAACLPRLELDREARDRIAMALVSETDPDVRFDVLVGVGGDDLAALTSIAASDPDERVRRKARVKVLTQRSPVEGWLVEEVEPDAPGAAFLLLADVIVESRELPLPTTEAPLPSPRTLEVLRDGQIIWLDVTDLRGLETRRVHAEKANR